MRTTHCGNNSADCGTSKKWTYYKVDGGHQFHFYLGNNWTIVANGSQHQNSETYTDRVNFIQLGTEGNIGYLDNIKCYNNSPSYNISNSIHAFKPVSVNSFNRTNAYWYGNTSGVEILFNCNNNTPTQKITSNNTNLTCTNGQLSQQLTVWINLTGTTANVTFVNVTTFNFIGTSEADITAPIVNVSINNTSPKRYEFINISANITDETGLLFANITINFSTGLVKMNYTISGTSVSIYNITNITDGRGNVLLITVYTTDTSNNVRQNLTLITVANTIPNGTNFVNTTGKHYNTNQTRLNYTACNDPDGDVCRYIVYWDLDITPTSVYYNGTDLNLSTNWTSDNTYFYQIKVMDGESESALSPVFNLTLDTGTPTLTINITNNTFTRFNNTFNFYLEDSFPYNLTVRVYMGSNNYHANISSSVFGRFINITGLFNLTEDGNYTIEINASDSDKTSPKIDGNLERSKKGEAEYVINDSLNDISYKMLIRFEDKNENELITPADYKSYANYNSKGTHIDFGLNVTSNRNGFIPVYEINTENVNIAILNDSIKGHLVWHPYGTDFEGRLLVNGIERNYSINIKKITDTRVKASIIPATDIMNNDVVVFKSETIFGLNTIDISNILVIDRTAPTFISAYNRTTSTNSTTITTATNVDTCIEGLDDLYLDRGNFSHNASGSWANQSMTMAGNKTRYCNTIGSGSFTANQVVGWKFYVYDIAGNELDPIYTFSIGSSQATSTSTIGSGGGSSGGGGAIGATRQCKEYSLAYKTCYYFDGISQCLKGCQRGQLCNVSYECFGNITTQAITQTTSLQSPLNAVTSPISRFFTWVKSLLGLSTNNPELSVLGGSISIVEDKSIKESINSLKEKTTTAFQQNKWLPYIIVASVILGFAIYVFGLWQTPLALLMGLGAWGYIIIFILLIILYIFFKYF